MSTISFLGTKNIPKSSIILSLNPDQFSGTNPIRRCTFCGVWKIEPRRWDKTSEEIMAEITVIRKNKVIFFDNNFLANKNIEKILSDLADLKVNGRPVFFECQSGFDGRLLERNTNLAALLKKARFRNVRIAWDNSLSDRWSVKRQLDYLVQAGYSSKDLSIFMIYNFDIPYEAMLRKIDYCRKWGVQITDCRYRPLDSVEDNYNPAEFKTGQTLDDYYIHEKAGWTDKKVRGFRRRVRQHNIWVRYARDKGLAYDNRMEKWSRIHGTFKYFHMGRPPMLQVIENSATWAARLEKMNRVKNYYEKHNLNSLDFTGFSRKRVDDELDRVLAKIDRLKAETKGK